MFCDPNAPMEHRADYYSAKGSRAAARRAAYLGGLGEKQQEQSLFQTRVCEIFLRRERDEEGVHGVPTR